MPNDDMKWVGQAEGVYLEWQAYPPKTRGIASNVLAMARRGANGSIEQISLTRNEADVVRHFLNESMSAPKQ